MNQTSTQFHAEEVSPLHTLEKQLVRSGSLRKGRRSSARPLSTNSIPNDFDHESIYSFESVSTNGRLLDRLELSEGEDELDFEPDDCSITSTGRLLDRLQLAQNTKSNLSIKGVNVQPRNIKSSIGTFQPFQQPTHRRTSQQAFVQQHIRHVPMNLVFENISKSSETIESNMATLNKTDTNSSTPSAINSVPEESFDLFASEESPVRSPSSGSSQSTFTGMPEPRRINSDGSASSFVLPYKNESLTAEARISLAQELRKIGKHREASYQLQIAANKPFFDTKAMYLYSMALHLGQGVRQNDCHAIKWLCKCLLMNFPHINSSNSALISEKLNSLSAEELIRLIMKNLQVTMNKDEHLNGNDPTMLYPIFKSLSKAQITKIIHICKNKLDIASVAYHELGNFLINGWGLDHRDELVGIACLSKAGSMGNIDSMTQLGDIWCNKTKYHKKDLCKAAAWLRLSEIFGITTIGNSWIYKEKYMSSS